MDVSCWLDVYSVYDKMMYLDLKHAVRKHSFPYAISDPQGTTT